MKEDQAIIIFCLMQTLHVGDMSKPDKALTILSSYNGSAMNSCGFGGIPFVQPSIKQFFSLLMWLRDETPVLQSPCDQERESQPDQRREASRWSRDEACVSPHILFFSHVIKMSHMCFRNPTLEKMPKWSRNKIPNWWRDEGHGMLASPNDQR